MRAGLPRLVLRHPELVFAAAKHVAGVREGRHPAAVLKPCVPADVVGVQVGAKDVVDAVRRGTGRFQAVEEAGLQMAPVGPGAALLAVAHAATDPDTLAADLDHPGMHAEQDAPPDRVIVTRCHPAEVVLQVLLGREREEA